MQEFQVFRVLVSTLRMKAQADSSSRGQKDFICREEKRKAAWGARRWIWKSVSHGLGWRLGFIAFLCFAQRQRCLSGADRGFLGRRSVSLTTYHLLGPPAVCSSVSLDINV
jgi:hypothetical protein